jgi:major membrane immunogen (membrane-anchored lipoprotein)
MKKQGRLFLGIILFASLLSGCTKNDALLENASLRQAIDQSALSLNNAMEKIAASQAFSILTVSEGGTAKAENETTYKVYIPLDLVKGVYDYKPVTGFDRWGISLIRYFSKSSDNSKMIVNMPLKKVKDPRSLRRYDVEDSLLTNNFSISVSDYHNNYNSYHDYDYILSSEISVDNTLAGKLNIKSIVSPALGIEYASQYSFTDSYTANYMYESGDTTISGFSIKNGEDVLYKEELLTIKNDTARFGREHLYTLTIGNVQILRNLAKKTVQIAVDGEIQEAAKVEIIDKVTDPEASVCKKRDIQITFEDGTVTTVSELIGVSVGDIRTLFESLHQVYFAAYIVDWIAYDIYYQRN